MRKHHHKRLGHVMERRGFQVRDCEGVGKAYYVRVRY